MRFLFENGGRTGAKNTEALAGALAGYFVAQPDVLNVELESNALVLFRDEETLTRELSHCLQEAKERHGVQGRQFDQKDIYEALYVLAATYWAEAERLELDRSTPVGTAKVTARI
ncbi:hypothetical protein GTP44_13935 [Duganella sp. FT50W]|uniref:Uncharacterized protein n=1 Tax=Duganella lactea TaxID=2692173 RepID=A0A6L8MMB4_9BURK|nr:hypothetical protein [Duganella lactea]MYM83052.1 hypothetical protein [Duganella lactea]